MIENHKTSNRSNQTSRFQGISTTPQNSKKAIKHSRTTIRMSRYLFLGIIILLIPSTLQGDPFFDDPFFGGTKGKTKKKGKPPPKPNVGCMIDHCKDCDFTNVYTCNQCDYGFHLLTYFGQEKRRDYQQCIRSLFFWLMVLSTLLLFGCLCPLAALGAYYLGLYQSTVTVQDNSAPEVEYQDHRKVDDGDDEVNIHVEDVPHNPQDYHINLAPPPAPRTDTVNIHLQNPHTIDPSQAYHVFRQHEVPYQHYSGSSQSHHSATKVRVVEVGPRSYVVEKKIYEKRRLFRPKVKSYDVRASPKKTTRKYLKKGTRSKSRDRRSRRSRRSRGSRRSAGSGGSSSGGSRKRRRSSGR